MKSCTRKAKILKESCSNSLTTNLFSCDKRKKPLKFELKIYCNGVAKRRSLIGYRDYSGADKTPHAVTINQSDLCSEGSFPRFENILQCALCLGCFAMTRLSGRLFSSLKPMLAEGKEIKCHNNTETWSQPDQAERACIYNITITVGQ